MRLFKPFKTFLPKFYFQHQLERQAGKPAWSMSYLFRANARKFSLVHQLQVIYLGLSLGIWTWVNRNQWTKREEINRCRHDQGDGQENKLKSNYDQYGARYKASASEYCGSEEEEKRFQILLLSGCEDHNCSLW